MSGFIGRTRELALLDKRLRRVASASEATAVAIRGRRQVGKSRLVQEFCDRARVPYLYFAATKGASPVEDIAAFLGELRDSTLVRDPELVPRPETGNWPDAFRILASALPDVPAIVVLDEVPWLAEQDDLFDGALQTAWDRLLRERPVLLLLLGSDLHMMERLTAYEQPFHGRADNLVLGPLNPAETGAALGLDGAEALDAHLVSGGLPGILRAWPHGTPALEFLRDECVDPASPVFGVPETALLAEFPNPDTARRVLEAIGAGDRTHATIAATAGSRAGTLPSGTLSPVLSRLVVEKRVLAVDHPLSARPGKPALYRVADSNLRLYLAMLRAAHEQVQRGRPEAAFALIRRRWPTWRGRAIEPLVRQALELAAFSGALPWTGTEVVGGWWNRRFNPEVDLVGADRAPVAARLLFAGSVKWLDSPFDRHDLADLQRTAPQVPGFDPSRSGLAVVSLSGTTADLDLHAVGLAWSAPDLISAWVE
ncbi:AAA family ATPase [Streptomyces synnematoformans]|uniref:ATP-binding protein n=1 Tax=Streptomyces synnematoformans TaxID=415721 RepID=A0ABN2Y7G4_9ACTN